ncbi:oligopeptide/dipeptide ABC transporter, ATPase subunit [Sulfolobus islandicus Y.N.15.51]|jgi:oligopeptide/dipeptide ABC transporter ATP-binding protein|uniref:Oligopeptide/dipeptide ABC transporter, ATPase subunit n=1 Tax=Saccharolobus islandicus (strain Y.N.15.51 / Yellowstone \|nr:ABC transporter ATP-binding protein [Sulfolobus islandicus]ACP47535.1 oligopeptide/dipeptide ABC transporter, ATPase subunit [Sulfolobus islandicus Y.N.15.51]
MSNKLLSLENLWITYYKGNKSAYAVRGVSLEVNYNQVVGIVGESGSGKSTLGHSIIGLLPNNAKVEKGKIIFEETDLAKINKSDFYRFRGKRGIFMIFQDPMTSLNPTIKVKEQLVEIIKNRPNENSVNTLSHWFIGKVNKSEIVRDEKQLIESLKKVGFRNPDEILDKYPHQLSGGERQRIMIAMAYLLKPKLLIADEPTTALDVITQAQVLKMLLELKEEYKSSIIFISHDITLVSQISDKVIVMYGGIVMEEASSEEILKNPLNPYTKGLVASIPNYFKGKGKISSIPGFPPNIFELPQGCPFNPRCNLAMSVCKSQLPKLKSIGESHSVACHLYS